MFIFPYSVKFLLFQLLSVFSKFRIFSAKFNSLVLFVSYEKKIPRAFIGSRGQRKPKGVSVLFFHRPSHIPSDFVVLISRPERFLNLSSRVSKWSTESRSRTKTVVSSAYRETLISFSPTLMPFMPVLMTRHYLDLGSASDWLKRAGTSFQPIRSITKI